MTGIGFGMNLSRSNNPDNPGESCSAGHGAIPLHLGALFSDPSHECVWLSEEIEMFSLDFTDPAQIPPKQQVWNN